MTPGTPGMGMMMAVHEDVHQYHSRFVYTGRPVRILKGVVRDRKTREPVAGVRLSVSGITTASGIDGEFEISACLKRDRYVVSLETTSGKYLNEAVEVEDSPGTGILEHDFFLRTAITARGRVTDRETGEPFAGTVEYNPLFPNVNLSRLNLISAAIPRSSVEIGKDGSWELQVLPGPGVLLVRGADLYSNRVWWPGKDVYTSPRIDMNRLLEVLEGTDQGNLISTEEGIHFDTGQGSFSSSLSEFKSVALIRPSIDFLLDSGKVFTQDMVVVRGWDIQGIVLDPEGRPITGVVVTGLSLDSNLRIFLKDERFAVNCVSPDSPRRLAFYQQEKNLKADVVVEPGFRGPLTVRLTPAAE